MSILIIIITSVQYWQKTNEFTLCVKTIEVDVTCNVLYLNNLALPQEIKKIVILVRKRQLWEKNLRYKNHINRL